MEEIQKKLQRIVETLFDVKVEVMVTPAPENTGADYASNIAMQLAKIVHRAPMVIAEMVKDEFSKRIADNGQTSSSEDAMLTHGMSNTARSASPSSSNSTHSKRFHEMEFVQSVSSGEPDIAVEIAAPGFLNFTVNDEEVNRKVEQWAQDFEQSIAWDEYRGKTIVAEFSDPNPFKVLHVGHLYTSVVGDSISRLCQFAGAKVIRANFGGDVGLHVAKTLYKLQDSLSPRITSSDSPVRSRRMSNTAPLRASNLPRTSSEIASSQEVGTKLAPGFESGEQAQITSSDETDAKLASGCEPVGQSRQSNEEKLYRVLQELTIEDIAKCYVEGTRAYEEDEAAKEEITRLNKEIYRINAEDLHDSPLAQLYWRGRELSYEYFENFYQRIGVKFDKYYPESSVAERGVREVRAHTGTTYEESNGAIVYHGEKVGLHTRVFINAQGVPTYETKDVGLLFTKWDDWHFDESIVVTGNEQSDYMKVVLASVSEYAPKLVERTTHLTHGLVKLPGNVKMSSRKGNFLKAVDVLQLVEDQLKNSSATSRIADNGQISASEDAMLTHGMSNTARSASPSSLNSTHSKQSNGAAETQHEVALAAIKYAFLKYKMGGDIVFDPQESVSMTGNSGVYLLYATVRAQKILQKRTQKASEGELSAEEKKYTKDLNKKIIQYREVLQEAVREKAPYKVCTYLYELAQEFSRFYEHVKVAGNACETELMKTVQVYALVMKHGLEKILGIEVPEQM